MKQYLENSIEKFHLKLLNDEFSPITKISAAMCLDYLDLFKMGNNIPNKPFFICFPSKGNYALWISVLLELNLFFEDQIYEENNNLNLIKNQKIELYGAVGKYLQIAPENNNCWKIEFKDQTINIPIQENIKYLKITEQSRILNLSKKYYSNKKIFFEERNVLSKIFFSKNKKEIFEYNKAISKILLITGRGNSNKFRQILSETKIDNDSLCKIFRTDKNLIIRPDLEEYVNYFSNNYSNKFSSFIDLIKRLKVETKIHELKEKLTKIQEWKIIDQSNLEEFQSIYDDYIDVERKLEHVRNNFPGITPESKFDFKAVIINDISIYYNYTELIETIIKEGIPLIFIYEQRANSKNEIVSTKEILNKKADSYFLCWTLPKVSLFKTNSSKYIDHDDYENTINFLTKKIIIECTDFIRFDSIFTNTLSVIKKINEKEIKNICYRYLIPIIFNLRCSNSKAKIISNILNEFSDKLDLLKAYFKDGEYEIIASLISELTTFSNNKYIDVENSMVFSYESAFNSNTYYTPSGSNRQKKLNNTKEKIIFSGFPSIEFTEQPLMCSIFDFYYQTINIKCWQIEGRMTYNYIKNRLLNGLIKEHTPAKRNIQKEYFLETEEDIFREISNKLNIINNIDSESEITKIEEVFLSIKEAKFSEFSIENNENELKPTECNVLYFPEDKFMFIPKEGNKVLVGLEAKNGGYLINRIDPVNLQKGMYYFDVDYSVSIKDLLILSNLSEKEAVIIVEELKKWKKALLVIYNYCSTNNINPVTFLNTVKNENFELLSKSNPSNSNLKYWINDDEIISLSKENLYLISKASEKIKYSFTKEDAEETYSQRNKVKGKLNSLNARIKTRIQTLYNKHDIKSSQNFVFTENNVKIDVNAYQIIMIDSENGFYVEYSKTRKLLC